MLHVCEKAEELGRAGRRGGRAGWEDRQECLVLWKTLLPIAAVLLLHAFYELFSLSHNNILITCIYVSYIFLTWHILCLSL